MTAVEPEAREVPRSRTSRALLLLAGVQFVMILTMSMLSSCLVSIQDSLPTSTPRLSLVTAAYGMAFAGLLLLAGAVVDRGRARRVLTGGLAVFVLGCVVAAAAPGIDVLLAGRVLQGAGAAFAVPAALVLVGVTHPEPADRARAMALWGVVSGLGGVAGLLYGGIVGDLASWRWTFTLPVLFAVAAVVALPRLVTDDAEGHGGAVNHVGAVAATIALGTSSYALITGPEDGWTSRVVLACLAVAAVAAVAGVLAERRSPDPLVPPVLLRSPSRLLALLTVFLASTAVTTSFFMLAVHYQQVLGWNELQTSLGFVPIGAALFAVSLLASRVVERVPGIPPWGLPAGTALTAVGLWLVGTGVAADRYAVLLPGLLVLPCGAAVMFAASTVVGMADVDGTTAGRAGGLLNAVMEAGPTFGLAAITSLATAVTYAHTSAPGAGDTSDGFATALHVSGGAYLAVAVILAVLVPAARPGHRNQMGYSA